jgi:hypothetical protein
MRPSISPGTDAAAGASAAFAACSNLYANRNLGSSYSTPASLQNSSYAATLLTHAQDLYAFAVNASGGQQTFQTAVPEAGIAYPSSSYGDDLAMAALFLASATNSSEYYSQAEGYYHQYSLGATTAVFNWDSKAPGLAVLFAQLANAGAPFAGNLSGWQTAAERYFDRILNGGGPSFKTNGARFCSSPAYPLVEAENDLQGGCYGILVILMTRLSTPHSMPQCFCPDMPKLLLHRRRGRITLCVFFPKKLCGPPR